MITTLHSTVWCVNASVWSYLYWLCYHVTIGLVNVVRQDNIIGNIFSFLSTLFCHPGGSLSEFLHWGWKSLDIRVCSRQENAVRFSKQTWKYCGCRVFCRVLSHSHLLSKVCEPIIACCYVTTTYPLRLAWSVTLWSLQQPLQMPTNSTGARPGEPL